MSLRTVLAMGLLVAASSMSSLSKADEPAGNGSRKATHKVKKGPFKVEVALSGVLDARDMTPISLHTEAWSSLSVLDALEHGTRVKPGDRLVTFDMEGLDTAIAEAEAAQKLTQLTIDLTKSELQATEAALPIDLAAAERAKRTTEEDLQRFLEKTRPLLEKSAENNLRSARHYVEYQEEELNQLEKMYRADDLTEETEEIILKRARNDLEQARFYLEMTLNQHDETLKIDLPRQETQIKERARREAIEFEKSKAELPLGPGKLRLTIEKLTHDLRQGDVRLTKLKHDREAMLALAPVEGLLYYGQCRRGHWSAGTAAEGKFARGTTLSGNTVFMTIIKERPLFVRSSTSEKDLRLVRPGVGGRAVSTAFPDLSLPVKVDSVAAVPTADGHFDTKLAVELPAQADALLPGMTCNVTLLAYSKPDAIAVPSSSVFSDEFDPQKHFVYRVGGDGSHQKADVSVGHRTDNKIEIVQGLLEGDTILLEDPEAKK